MKVKYTQLCISTSWAKLYEKMIDYYKILGIEKSASQENTTDEGASSKEKTQSNNNEVKNLSDVSSLKEQKEKVSLEQNIDSA